MGADFYPGNMDSKALWYKNFAARIGEFAAKYNITPAQLAAIEADNEWMQYWTRQRTAAAVFASQLAAYYNSISGNDSTLDPPSMPTFELTSGPTEVPPGIEARAREIARQIKGHSSYAEADGTALGIIGESGSFQGFGSSITPSIQTAAAGSNYKFSVTVTMRGASDAWQVWATLANENKWSIIATATGKSAEITWTPKGETRSPEMLNVRIQLRKNNQDYGEPSAISPVTVNP